MFRSIKRIPRSILNRLKDPKPVFMRVITSLPFVTNENLDAKKIREYDFSNNEWNELLIQEFDKGNVLAIAIFAIHMVENQTYLEILEGNTLKRLCESIFQSGHKIEFEKLDFYNSLKSYLRNLDDSVARKIVDEIFPANADTNNPSTIGYERSIPSTRSGYSTAPWFMRALDVSFSLSTTTFYDFLRQPRVKFVSEEGQSETWFLESFISTDNEEDDDFRESINKLLDKENIQLNFQNLVSLLSHRYKSDILQAKSFVLGEFKNAKRSQTQDKIAQKLLKHFNNFVQRQNLWEMSNGLQKQLSKGFDIDFSIYESIIICANICAKYHQICQLPDANSEKELEHIEQLISKLDESKGRNTFVTSVSTQDSDTRNALLSLYSKMSKNEENSIESDSEITSSVESESEITLSVIDESPRIQYSFILDPEKKLMLVQEQTFSGLLREIESKSDSSGVKPNGFSLNDFAGLAKAYCYQEEFLKFFRTQNTSSLNSIRKQLTSRQAEWNESCLDSLRNLISQMIRGTNKWHDEYSKTEGANMPEVRNVLEMFKSKGWLTERSFARSLFGKESAEATAFIPVNETFSKNLETIPYEELVKVYEVLYPVFTKMQSLVMQQRQKITTAKQEEKTAIDALFTQLEEAIKEHDAAYADNIKDDFVKNEHTNIHERIGRFCETHDIKIEGLIAKPSKIVMRYFFHENSKRKPSLANDLKKLTAEIKKSKDVLLQAKEAVSIADKLRLTRLNNLASQKARIEKIRMQYEDHLKFTKSDKLIKTIERCKKKESELQIMIDDGNNNYQGATVEKLTAFCKSADKLKNSTDSFISELQELIQKIKISQRDELNEIRLQLLELMEKIYDIECKLYDEKQPHGHDGSKNIDQFVDRIVRTNYKTIAEYDEILEEAGRELKASQAQLESKVKRLFKKYHKEFVQAQERTANAAEKAGVVAQGTRGLDYPFIVECRNDEDDFLRKVEGMILKTISKLSDCITRPELTIDQLKQEIVKLHANYKGKFGVITLLNKETERLNKLREDNERKAIENRKVEIRLEFQSILEGLSQAYAKYKNPEIKLTGTYPELKKLHEECEAYEKKWKKYLQENFILDYAELEILRLLPRAKFEEVKQELNDATKKFNEAAAKIAELLTKELLNVSIAENLQTISALVGLIEAARSKFAETLNTLSLKGDDPVKWANMTVGSIINTANMALYNRPNSQQLNYDQLHIIDKDNVKALGQIYLKLSHMTSLINEQTKIIIQYENDQKDYYSRLLTNVKSLQPEIDILNQLTSKSYAKDEAQKLLNKIKDWQALPEANAKDLKDKVTAAQVITEKVRELNERVKKLEDELSRQYAQFEIKRDAFTIGNKFLELVAKAQKLNIKIDEYNDLVKEINNLNTSISNAAAIKDNADELTALMSRIDSMSEKLRQPMVDLNSSIQTKIIADVSTGIDTFNKHNPAIHYEDKQLDDAIDTLFAMLKMQRANTLSQEQVVAKIMQQPANNISNYLASIISNLSSINELISEYKKQKSRKEEESKQATAKKRYKKLLRTFNMIAETLAIVLPDKIEAIRRAHSSLITNYTQKLETQKDSDLWHQTAAEYTLALEKEMNELTEVLQKATPDYIFLKLIPYNELLSTVYDLIKDDDYMRYLHVLHLRSSLSLLTFTEKETFSKIDRDELNHFLNKSAEFIHSVIINLPSAIENAMAEIFSKALLNALQKQLALLNQYEKFVNQDDELEKSQFNKLKSDLKNAENLTKEKQEQLLQRATKAVQGLQERAALAEHDALLLKFTTLKKLFEIVAPAMVSEMDSKHESLVDRYTMMLGKVHGSEWLSIAKEYSEELNKEISDLTILLETSVRNYLSKHLKEYNELLSQLHELIKHDDVNVYPEILTLRKLLNLSIAKEATFTSILPASFSSILSKPHAELETILIDLPEKVSLATKRLQQEERLNNDGLEQLSLLLNEAETAFKANLERLLGENHPDLASIDTSISVIRKNIEKEIVDVRTDEKRQNFVAKFKKQLQEQIEKQYKEKIAKAKADIKIQVTKITKKHEELMSAEEKELFASLKILADPKNVATLLTLTEKSTAATGLVGQLIERSKAPKKPVPKPEPTGPQTVIEQPQPAKQQDGNNSPSNGNTVGILTTLSTKSKTVTLQATDNESVATRPFNENARRCSSVYSYYESHFVGKLREALSRYDGTEYSRYVKRPLNGLSKKLNAPDDEVIQQYNFKELKNHFNSLLQTTKENLPKPLKFGEHNMIRLRLGFKSFIRSLTGGRLCEETGKDKYDDWRTQSENQVTIQAAQTTINHHLFTLGNLQAPRQDTVQVSYRTTQPQTIPNSKRPQLSNNESPSNKKEFLSFIPSTSPSRIELDNQITKMLNNLDVIKTNIRNHNYHSLQKITDQEIKDFHKELDQIASDLTSLQKRLQKHIPSTAISLKEFKENDSSDTTPRGYAAVRTHYKKVRGDIAAKIQERSNLQARASVRK